MTVVRLHKPLVYVKVSLLLIDISLLVHQSDMVFVAPKKFCKLLLLLRPGGCIKLWFFALLAEDLVHLLAEIEFTKHALDLLIVTEEVSPEVFDLVCPRLFATFVLKFNQVHMLLITLTKANELTLACWICHASTAKSKVDLAFKDGTHTVLFCVKCISAA